MFDYVTGVEVDCPKCGNKVSDFQSKDGDCLLDELDFRTVLRFYTSCWFCKTWIEFTHKKLVELEKPERPRVADCLGEYVMTIEPKGE